MKSESEMPAAPNALHLSRAFIDDHFADSIEIAHVAARAHFSRYHFIRVFRRVFHETPHEYLTRKRIEKAKELLALSDLSVTEICFAVGFESLGSFSALFRKMVGWAPSVYRARVLAQRQTPYRFIPNCFVVMYGLRPASKSSNFQEAQVEKL